MSYAVLDSENVVAGATVRVTMNFKWYINMNKDILANNVYLTTNYNGTSQPVAISNINIGTPSGDSQYFTCTFTFKMPDGDVTVTVDPSGFTNKTKVAVSGAAVYKYDYISFTSASSDLDMGGEYYVKLDSALVTAGKNPYVTLTYKDENGKEISYPQPASSTITDPSGNLYGAFILDRSSSVDPGDISLIPLGAKFTVSVSYSDY